MPAAPETDARAIDCFSLDGQFDRLPLWCETVDGRLLHHVDARVFLWVGAGHRTIQLVARRDHRRLRIMLMRVVRELATLQALHRGDLSVHAAALVHHGRAIVIAGARRSGKSSMLLGFLRNGQARYLSNDRVLLDGSAGTPIVYGMPTVANVRADSLAYLPSLAVPAIDAWQRFYLTTEECASRSPLIEPTRRALPPMNTTQICRWLGVPAQVSAPLGLLVFPRVDPAVDRFELRDVDATEAAGLLRGSLFSSGPFGHVSEAFGSGWEGRVLTEAEANDVCRHIAAGCIARECRLGPLAFHVPGVCEALMAALA